MALNIIFSVLIPKTHPILHGLKISEGYFFIEWY